MSGSLAAALAEARARLAAAGIDSAALDARLLVGDVVAMDAARLFLDGARPMSDDELRRIETHVGRRLGGEPVHRILGRRPFYAHDFKLSPETLEPRPDTEILVEACRGAIEAAIARQGTCLLADVGTGTGAIAVSLLALYPQARALGIDISAQALSTARENAAAAGVGARFETVLGDHLSGIDGPVDIVVSNPPYIPSAEIARLAREVRQHDPPAALDGGPDGLRSYRAIAEDAPRVLAPEGRVALEIGAGQGPDVVDIFTAKGFTPTACERDLAGIERVLLFHLWI